MKIFTITFTTLDGNTQQIEIDAPTMRKALFDFENNYQFEEINSCIQLTN